MTSIYVPGGEKVKRRVAVVGYSFRFPGTNSSQYWQDLLDGRDLVTEVEPARWAQDTFLHPSKNHPGTSYTFAAGSIGDVSGFDAGFFGISPREAALMDPQQRLLLEMSWEALENSGVRPSSLHGSRCGVFIGIASTDYSYRLADDLAAIDASVATGNTASIAANRISYIFDLCGPSMAIDTACSSSMVAFHQACSSIISGESVQALTGGISLHLHPYGFLTFSKASMLSRQGRCRVFDAAADGYVRSEGGGIFFLKEYAQAVADDNPILAVVATTAVNADGRKSGLTVPKSKSQAALLEQAYAQTGIDPADIDYLEAHGTGTVIGDPLETRAIGKALGQRRSSDHPLLIGSVKGNIGHLEAASGVAGLVKALHCLQHRMVPATIGLENPNPNIPFDELNVEVVTENRQLKSEGRLIVGVNSFGFGGANAHVILESHKRIEAKISEHQQNTLSRVMLSAKNPVALKAAAHDFSIFLERETQASLYDIAFNAMSRREWHGHRAIIHGATKEAIARELYNFTNDVPGQVQTGIALNAPSGPAFIYSGNGSQWAGMGKRLLEESPLFRETIREIDHLFRRFANYSLEGELSGKNGTGRYNHTEIAQPALFALQVGITEMLRLRGVLPVAVAGHSVGEVAASWAAGILTLDTAVEVIYHRSRLQGMTKGCGQMTAVGLGQKAALRLLKELAITPGLALAGMNSSRGVTVAGDSRSLAQLEAVLTQRAIFYKRLDLDYAFHSPAMDSIEAGVKQSLAKIQPRQSHLPFYSTVTGHLVDGRELDAEYWWRNIRNPVLFEQAIKIMRTEGINIFIEVGPHAVLRSYLNDCQKDSGTEGRIISTLTRGDDSSQRILRACDQALIAGVPIDWSLLFPKPGQFIQLPNYPWQRERYWHPVTPASLGLLDRRKTHPLLGYPLKQHELTWENHIDTKANPTLADHVIGEAVVYPGTGFVELALAAALAWLPGDLVEIEDVEIRAPLVLSGAQSTCIRLNIEVQDGGLRVIGREDAADIEPWTLHAVGRILREPNDRLLRQECPDLPVRHPDFNGISHEVLTKTVGLSYGPAFRCIDHGWTEQHSVLALFKLPECIAGEMEHAHLHPALLDCTFQLIIQLLTENLDVHEGFAFVPVRMGRIVFRKGLGKPHLARATLLRCTPQSLSADFTVFDADGAVVAVVMEVRFRSILVGKNTLDRQRFLDDQWVPMPHPLALDVSPLIPFSKVRLAFAEMTRRAALSGPHRRYSEEVDPLLDSLCQKFTLEALQQLATDDKQLSLQKLLVCETASPKIKPYLAHLLAQAEDDRSIMGTPGGWEVLPGLEEQISAQDIWNSLVTDYPDFFHITHAVGRIGMHLALIFEGKMTQVQACPRKATPATLTCQVLGAEGKQQIGQTLHHLILQAITQLPEGRRLGILEIAQGSPYYAGDIIDDNCRCDYVFAGTSVSMEEDAVHLQKRFPHIDIRVIDASLDKRGLEPIHQLAVVTLDFNTITEAIRALKFARACLAPGGTLMVIGVHPSRWYDFVFGGLDTHWSATDEGPWRSNQRTAKFWHQQVQQLQLVDITLLEMSPDTLSGPYLLLAQSALDSVSLAPPSHRELPRSWVLLADPDGLSAQLSDQLTKKLQTRGDLVVQACSGGRDQLQALLRETTASYGQLDGIVHLAGLSSLPDSTDATAVLERQVTRCAVAADIMQACETTQTKTTCWLITAGVGQTPLARRSGEEAPANAMFSSDAALWGFGRTLMNEAVDLSIRLVDLAHPVVSETLVSALEQELEQPDNEQEILLTARGNRYAARIGLVPRSEIKKSMMEQIDSPTVTLGFHCPGKLRNLRWETRPGHQLGDQEIEVEVKATGLNFRDLMYTLGLLSDEAIENGFAGPTLGLEFSGIVRKVGNPAGRYAPGDKVVGFGPSSFANRVITQEDAVTHLPSSITFEAAATIPCTFFTVYYALHHLARLQPGEKVLIHCAAGGVGIAAIQLAKWLRAEIFVTAGSDEKRDFLRMLGVEHIFDSRSLAFADDIIATTGGKGVDVVLNSLAGDAIHHNLRILKPFGRFLELGKRDFYENTKIGLRPFRNNISYFGIDTDQLMHACPDLTRTLFSKVMDLFADGILHPLPYHIFEADNIVDAFRYMQQARHIGKIVITYRNGISKVVDIPCHPGREQLLVAADGSYLVTGGLGGFGLRTAQWLADKGARHLVLISRSGPGSEEAQKALAKLHQQGVRVHAVSCDVTNKTALAALLIEIAETMPPLKGIVHAATVINDGLIRTMDTQQIRKVLAPKALGAFHLHTLTLDRTLDFFILYSSATTLFGNPGQGNYVAANACLEALARNRRAAGLAATCVRWGAIEDVGFLARNQKIKESLQSRMGGASLNSTVALEILENMLVADCSGLGVMEIDWRAISRFLPSAASPKFSELARVAGEGGRDEEDSDTIQQMMEELSDEELLQACIVLLKTEVGEILRIAPDKIEPSRSMYDMGMDSLMGVELVGALDTRFGVRLPIMALGQSPTIAQLAEQIIRLLKGDDEKGEAAAVEEELMAQAQHLAMQHGSEVSTRSIVQLTEELQSVEMFAHNRIIH